MCICTKVITNYLSRKWTINLTKVDQVRKEAVKTIMRYLPIEE